MRDLLRWVSTHLTMTRFRLWRALQPARHPWMPLAVWQRLAPPAMAQLYAMARYATPGKSEVVWCTTIGTPSAPTSTELNAGVDITSFCRVLPSVPRGLNLVDVADLSSKYEKRQVGTRGGDVLSVEVFRDDATDTAVTTLTEDTAGFLVLARKGLATPGTFAIGDEVDVYPATVGSAEDNSPGRNDADTSNIQLVATGDPTRGFVLVA